MHGPTCIFWANLIPFSLQRFDDELLQDRMVAMSGLMDDDPGEAAAGAGGATLQLKAKVFLKLATWLQKDSIVRRIGALYYLPIHFIP